MDLQLTNDAVKFLLLVRVHRRCRHLYRNAILFALIGLMAIGGRRFDILSKGDLLSLVDYICLLPLDVRLAPFGDSALGNSIFVW